jgi:hypothetical protein
MMAALSRTVQFNRKAPARRPPAPLCLPALTRQAGQAGAKSAKKLPIFKALTPESSEMRFGRFRSGSSSDPAQAGLATRCDLGGLGGEIFG